MQHQRAGYALAVEGLGRSLMGCELPGLDVFELKPSRLDSNYTL